MTTTKDINEYLFYEFAFDLKNSTSSVSEDWPFQLKLAQSFLVDTNEEDIYIINYDGESHFVIDGAALSVIPTNEMSIEDLYLQEIGSHWINMQTPIDLSFCNIGETNLPNTKERKEKILNLARKYFNYQVNPIILEGLYFPKSKKYLSLIDYPEQTIVVATDFVIHNIPFPEASPWRRLSFGIGKRLASANSSKEDQK